MPLPGRGQVAISSFLGTEMNQLADYLATLDLCRAGLAAIGADPIHADRLTEIAALLRESSEITQALREICEEHAQLAGALMAGGLVITQEGQRFSYRWEALPSLGEGPCGDGCRSYAAAVTEALLAVRRGGR